MSKIEFECLHVMFAGRSRSGHESVICLANPPVTRWSRPPAFKLDRLGRVRISWEIAARLSFGIYYPLGSTIDGRPAFAMQTWSSIKRSVIRLRRKTTDVITTFDTTQTNRANEAKNSHLDRSKSLFYRMDLIWSVPIKSIDRSDLNPWTCWKYRDMSWLVLFATNEFYRDMIVWLCNDFVKFSATLSIESRWCVCESS